MTRGVPDLYAITDRRAVRGGDPVRAVEAAVRAGVRWVQVREKDLPSGALYELTREVLRVARPAGARVLVNDRADVALAAGAAGVHLAEDSIDPGRIRVLFPTLLVGVSVHSLERALAADAAGADFLLFGPVFDTPSKSGHGPPQGLETLGEVVRSVAVPVVAVGGIGPEETRACLAAGARGVAAIRGLLGAEDVALATHAYLEALGGR